MPLHAQKPETNIRFSPKYLLNLGKNAERLGDYYSAIDYYNQYLERDSGNCKVRYNKAELCRLIRDYSQAERDYLKTYSKDKNKYCEALYYAALMEINKGDYSIAMENLSKFKIAIKKNPPLKQKYKGIIDNHITSCQIAQHILDYAINVSIIHLDTSINKSHIEFSQLPLDV